MRKRILWNRKATDVSQLESGEWQVFTEKGLITVSNEDFQAEYQKSSYISDMWESACTGEDSNTEEDDYDYINNFVKVTD